MSDKGKAKLVVRVVDVAQFKGLGVLVEHWEDKAPTFSLSIVDPNDDVRDTVRLSIDGAAFLVRCLDEAIHCEMLQNLREGWPDG